MRNTFTQFKTHLQFLSPEEQILEINRLISDFLKNDHSYIDVKNKYNRIQQLKNLRHRILLSQEPLFFYHK